MAVWTEEEIAQVGDMMRKGLSLVKIYKSGFRAKTRSDKYGFYKLAVGEKSDLFSIELSKSVYNLQNSLHRKTDMKFSVSKVGKDMLQIERIK